MKQRYHVHVYREMRLYYPEIEADSPAETAEIAGRKPTYEAQYTEDCNGENLAALVDVASDTEHEQSVTIDFEAERLRKHAGKMLAALAAFIEAERMAEECHEWKWESLNPAFQLARPFPSASTTTKSIRAAATSTRMTRGWPSSSHAPRSKRISGRWMATSPAGA